MLLISPPSGPLHLTKCHQCSKTVLHFCHTFRIPERPPGAGVNKPTSSSMKYVQVMLWKCTVDAFGKQ